MNKEFLVKIKNTLCIRIFSLFRHWIFPICSSVIKNFSRNVEWFDVGMLEFWPTVTACWVEPYRGFMNSWSTPTVVRAHKPKKKKKIHYSQTKVIKCYTNLRHHLGNTFQCNMQLGKMRACQDCIAYRDGCIWTKNIT